MPRKKYRKVSRQLASLLLSEMRGVGIDLGQVPMPSPTMLKISGAGVVARHLGQGLGTDSAMTDVQKAVLRAMSGIAFGLVQNELNWKDEILAIVPIEMVPLLNYAIPYFAYTPPIVVEGLEDQMVRIEADGYWAFESSHHG